MLRRLGLPPLLREREFGRFWAGQTISMIGDQVTLIALPLTAVLVLHAGPGEMGTLTAAALAPNLVFALHAGAWVDRRARRRRTMIAADLGRAALLATVPVASALGVLTLTQLYVVAFLAGTLTVVFMVAYQALFVALVPRERYVEANTLVHGSRAMSFVLGPSLGGLLVQALSGPAALVVDAASYLGSAASMGSIAPAEPPPEPPAPGHVAAGVRYIAASPVVRACLLATATVNLFNFMFWALFLLYVNRSLHISPGTIGLVLGSAAFGGVLGSVVTGALTRRIGVGPAFAFGCVLFTAPLMLVPLAGGPRPVVLAMLFTAEFVSGFGVMVLDIAANSILAAVVPDRVRARVTGAYLLVNYGVRPLGSLAGGALGAAIGLRPTLWIATAAAVAGGLLLLPTPVMRIHALPETAEDM